MLQNALLNAPLLVLPNATKDVLAYLPSVPKQAVKIYNTIISQLDDFLEVESFKTLANNMARARNSQKLDSRTTYLKALAYKELLEDAGHTDVSCSSLNHVARFYRNDRKIAEDLTLYKNLQKYHLFIDQINDTDLSDVIDNGSVFKLIAAALYLGESAGKAMTPKDRKRFFNLVKRLVPIATRIAQAPSLAKSYDKKSATTEYEVVKDLYIKKRVFNCFDFIWLLGEIKVIFGDSDDLETLIADWWYKVVDSTEYTLKNHIETFESPVVIDVQMITFMNTALEVAVSCNVDLNNPRYLEHLNSFISYASAVHTAGVNGKGIQPKKSKSKLGEMLDNGLCG